MIRINFRLMELMPINLFYEIVETRAERNSLFREEVFLHRQIKIYLKITLNENFNQKNREK